MAAISSSCDRARERAGDRRSLRLSRARGHCCGGRRNGTRQNFVEKLPVSTGGIALQLEGFPIDFRNVWLEQLKD